MKTQRFDFDKVVPRGGTDSAKWDKYSGRDVIPLWVADMDFQSPPPVLEALHRRIDHGVFGYGAIQAPVNEAVIAYLERAFDWRVPPDWLIWLPGVVTGLNVACRSVGRPDDTVVTTVPVYPPFLSTPKNSRRRLKTTDMVHDGRRWQIDFKGLERSMADGASMYILCNPQNPTGRVFRRDELTRLAQICLRHGAVICSDEIHCDLVLKPGCRHIPMATISDEIAQNTITLMAPSKTYNIPGLGCSFAVVPNPDLRRRFKRAMSGIVPYVNVMGLAATQVAYNRGGPWLEAVRHYLNGNLELVSTAISAMDGLSMTSPEATYLAWIDARGLQTPDPGRFFQNAGVGLSDGSDFKGPGFVRLNFACPRPLLAKALERMQAAVAASGPVSHNAC